jgi:hypothetical protein
VSSAHDVKTVELGATLYSTTGCFASTAPDFGGKFIHFSVDAPLRHERSGVIITGRAGLYETGSFIQALMEEFKASPDRPVMIAPRPAGATTTQ